MCDIASYTTIKNYSPRLLKKKNSGPSLCITLRLSKYDVFLFTCGMLHLFVILQLILSLKTVIMLIRNLIVDWAGCTIRLVQGS